MVMLTFPPDEGDGTPRDVQSNTDSKESRKTASGGVEESLREQLRISDRDRSYLFEAHPIPMWIYDTETLRFLAVNDATIQRYGYTREEFLELTLGDIRPPEDLPQLTRMLESMEAQTTFSGSWRHHDKNGKIFWVDVVSRAIVYAGHNGRLVAVTDVTERKRAESELYDVVRSVRCLLWRATVTVKPAERVNQVGLDWNVRIFNEAAGQNFLSIDFPGTQQQPDMPHLWALPEDVPHMIRISETAILGGERGYQLEYRSYDVNREIRWLWEDVMVEAEGPGIWNVIGITSDITDRKRGELALQESNKTLQSLIDASPIAVVAVDRLGIVRLWNAASERIFGWIEQEVLDRRAPFLSEGESPERDSLSEIILEGRHTMGFETTAVRKDGATINISVATAPVTNDEGAVISVMAMITDITHRKQLETERQHLIDEAAKLEDLDPLTGLLNHRTFHNRLKEEKDWAAASGAPLAIFLLDLDNFTFFNDTYGHRVGDEVLRRVASALSDVAEAEGLAALSRFSGDEFVFLIPGGDEARIARVIQKTRAGVDHLEYQPPGYDIVIPLTLSLGISIFPQDGPGSLDLLSAASTRLTRSKHGEGSVERSLRVRSTLARSREGFKMLDALVTAVDNKDGYTRRHSEDVMIYCDEIGQELGLDEKSRHHLEVAALLHDVGKIGVPDYILRKPGRLTEEEFHSVRQHPVMGAMMIGTVTGFEDVLDATRHHHERWDGGGYPFGLREEQTPLLARIMAVADAFSAMTTDRPYRKGIPPRKALEVLEEGAATQWDMNCVSAFVRARKRALV